MTQVLVRGVLTLLFWWALALLRLASSAAKARRQGRATSGGAVGKRSQLSLDRLTS